MTDDAADREIKEIEKGSELKELRRRIKESRKECKRQAGDSERNRERD